MARARHVLMTKARQFARNDEGATAIEYAVIAAGVAGMVASIVYTLGISVKTTFFDVIASGMQ